MRHLVIALVLLAVPAAAFAADAKDKRLAAIQQEMMVLAQKAVACQGSADCLAAIQAQMETLTKEYSALTSAPETTDRCTTSSDPCCWDEAAKQYIRDTSHVEPTWLQCLPITLELAWDMYFEDYTSQMQYVLRQEFPGVLSLSYDQVDKTRLKKFVTGGPVPKDQVQSTLISIQGAFTPATRWGGGPVKSRTSNNPADYIVSSAGGVEFVWDSQFGARGGGSHQASGPKTALCEKVCAHSGPWFGDRFDAAGDRALSEDELREGLKTGSATKEYKIDHSWDHGHGIYETAKGKLTLTVHFKPAGGMAVSPADAFQSSGPDINEVFTPIFKTYTLKNTTKSPIAFQVSKTADWLDLSATTGTIGPDESTPVRATINNAKARKLKSGTYRDTVTFTNATNGKGTTTRPVELTVGEGWQLDRMKWDGLVLKDKMGKTTKITKAVKFNWSLTGKFRIKKEEGRWVYKEGVVTAATLTPVAAFTPADLYACSVGECSGKAKIDSYVGKMIVGHISGTTVQLRWSPFNPGACLSCKPNHPDLPKTPYEAQFLSSEFITQISLESYVLANKTFPPTAKQDWLWYQVTLKRLK